MIEWREDAIVLGTLPFREKDCVLEVLTAHHGRHKGLVLRGGSDRQRSVLQPGNIVEVRWMARLEQQLGRFAVEHQMTVSGRLLSSGTGLAIIAAMTSLMSLCLPERDPNTDAYRISLAALIALRNHPDIFRYASWELDFLGVLGITIDVDNAYMASSNDFPAFISPRTGRVIGYGAASSWRKRLWPLPKSIAEQREAKTLDEVSEILNVTESLLLRHVVPGKQAALPYGARVLRHMITLPHVQASGDQDSNPVREPTCKALAPGNRVA